MTLHNFYILKYSLRKNKVSTKGDQDCNILSFVL